MGSKLSPHAFTRFWDLHAWAGVIAGLVLYLMFLTGGITLFHEQLELWEEPLAQRPWTQPRDLQTTLDVGLAAMDKTPDEMWFFPPAHGRGEARLSYEEGSTWKTAWVDPVSASLVPERERLAHFLYSLHFLWHDLTGQWLYTVAGLLAVALLIVLVTGVLIHLKDLVRQLHQFRPERSRRVLWSDMHKVLGVMGLPFQLMYAYTGAFIVLAPYLLQAFTGPVFGGDEKRAEAMAWGSVDDEASPAGPRAEVLTLDELARRAVIEQPGLSPQYFRLVHHGRENGVVEVRGKGTGSPAGQLAVRLRERDGDVDRTAGSEGVAADARRWINGLHFAHFGGLTIRFSFFVLALAAGLTILSGNWVWISRRRRSRGTSLLARLTAGFGAGTWVALGTLFLASRALPFHWSARGPAEELAFMGALAGSIVWALTVRDERKLWWRQLAVAGVLFLPVPLLAACWSPAGLFGSGPRLAPVVAVDVALILTALGLGAGAWCIRRAWARSEGARSDLVADAIEHATVIPRDPVLGHPGGSDA